MLLIDSAYLITAICFIIGVKYLNHPRKARKGNLIAAIGMFIAVIATICATKTLDYRIIIMGIIIGSILGATMARLVKMTSMPELVALLNGFGGGASALVAIAEFIYQYPQLAQNIKLLIIIVAVIVGASTITGSFIAFAKLSQLSKFHGFPGQQFINLLLLVMIIITSVLIFFNTSIGYIVTLTILSGILGVFTIIPIGGADMPVVISLLNAYSGIAASMSGFILMNNALIITGALVGASGIILTKIMCKAMNRSLVNILFAGLGTNNSSSVSDGKNINIKRSSVEEVAMIFDAADKIIIIPGYGMAFSPFSGDSLLVGFELSCS